MPSNSNILDANFLTYVAGILIPTTQISITSAFNSIPTATISMPPYPQLYGIGRKDRIPVHVFYMDNCIGEYILLFEGEVSGFSYSNSNYSRDITINAQGLLTFMQDVNVNFQSSLDEIARGYVPGESDTSLQKAAPGVTFPLSFFMYGLGEVTPENLVKVPTDYLDNSIEFLTEPGSMGEANDSALANFYAEYSDKIKLKDRYIPLRYFDEEDSEVWPADSSGAKVFPLLAGVQKAAAMDTLNAVLAYALQGGTLLQLINFVVNQMEYEFSFFTSPTMHNGKLVSMCLKPIFYDSVPPMCNVLYRSQVLSLSTAERTYGVPTRIRTRDLNGSFSHLAKGVNSAIKEYGIIDYYPSNKYLNVEPSESEVPKPNYISSELLDVDGGFDSETYTGPWVHETSAPTWRSYLGPHAIGENIEVFKKRLMRRLLHHKQYEQRGLSVVSGFTPYPVPGFPGVVFDSGDTGFIFTGLIHHVTHNISKSSMTTNVDFTFVNLLEETINEPMVNPIQSIENVTKDYERMSDITTEIIGVPCIDWGRANYLNDKEMQDDPHAALRAQYRNIVTFDEYCRFQGLTPIDGVIGDNVEVPIALEGLFTTDRRVPSAVSIPEFGPFDVGGETYSSDGGDFEGIRKILRTISEREFSKSVYIGGEAIDGMAKPRNASSKESATREAITLLGGQDNPGVNSAGLGTSSKTVTASGLEEWDLGEVTSVAEVLSGTAEQAKSNPNALADAVTAVTTPVTDSIKTVTGYVDTAVDTIRGTVDSVTGFVDSTIRGTIGTVTGILDGAIGTITDPTKDMISEIAGPLDDILREVGVPLHLESMANGMIDDAVHEVTDPVRREARKLAAPVYKVTGLARDKVDSVLDPIDDENYLIKSTVSSYARKASRIATAADKLKNKLPENNT